MTVSPKMQRVLESYRRIADRVDVRKFQAGDQTTVDWNLDDLFEQLNDDRGPRLLLGIYSPAGIRYVFEEYGLLKRIHGLGYDSITIRLDLKDPYRQICRVFGVEGGRDNDLLLELILHEERIRVLDYLPEMPRDLLGEPYLEVLVIDWLQMQRPRADFSRMRPRLPGQQHPGLGMGAEVMALLIILANRTRKDAIFATPQQFFNAWMYQQAFQFLYPKHEGRFRAILRDTEDHPLPETAWGIERGYLVDTATGKPFAWRGTPMVYPISQRALNYFGCNEYQRRLQEATRSFEFSPAWVQGQFDPEMFRPPANDVETKSVSR